MSLPDGEYEVDLSVLADNCGDVDSFGIRYGVVPSSLDSSKPMKLYDDSKNIILEATDTNNDQMIFEGMSQVHNSKNPAMANYYLAFESGGFRLSKLNRTVRVNKSRNSIKWANLIRKWNSQLESKKIISESDFEDLELSGFELEFDEKELEFDDGERVNDKEETQAKEAQKQLEENKKQQEKQRQHELQDQKLRQEQQDKLRKQNQEQLKREHEQKLKQRREHEQKLKQQREKTQVVNTNTSSVSKDDFDDLENQLQEVLGDSESDGDAGFGFSGGPITVIDGPRKPTTKPTGATKASKKPMSLRSFVGDTEDVELSVSEEE
ncbi:hypothetical protein PSN45_000332 [Yamadazyma tenuis]|uniref:uncharacterized protein n=1 Tax=Candida tenuis TaxID=2315449 RepID=UPI00279D2024|nr:hypothetical protein PSN45_000332 [Yamadazyma tenuis]